MKKLWAGIFCLILASSNGLGAGDPSFDVTPQNSWVGFSIQYLKLWEVTGCFKGIHGELLIESETGDLSAIQGSIEIESLQTGITLRDMHLKSKGYFNQTVYPVIFFKSHSLTYVSKDDFFIEGTITIKGSSKPVVFTGQTKRLQLNSGQGRKLEHLAFGVIDRGQFEIGTGYSNPEDLLISREVQFSIAAVICQDEQGELTWCAEKEVSSSPIAECE